MPHSYAVRITHAFDDMKPLIDIWSLRCDRMAVYEHVGERTNKVHIHLVIVDSEVCKEQLKNLAKPINIELKGNKVCSFKPFDGNEKALIYMTKGLYKYKYLKGYTEADAEAWKAKWEGEVGHSQPKDVIAYEACFDEQYDLSWLYHQRDHPNIYQSGCVPVSQNDYEYKFMKRQAHMYAFNAYRRIWNIQAANMYKMLVYTYVFRHDLVIPADDPAFKRM